MCARYVNRIPKYRANYHAREPRTPPAHPLMYRFPSTI